MKVNDIGSQHTDYKCQLVGWSLVLSFSDVSDQVNLMLINEILGALVCDDRWFRPYLLENKTVVDIMSVLFKNV